MHFFSVFVAILPSILLFCAFEIFHFLYTCVEVSVSVFFAFLIFFNLFHTIASSFLSSSASFFEKETLIFCSYLLSLGLLISVLGFTLFLLSVFSGTFNFCSVIYSAEFVLFSLGLFLSWYFSWLGVGGDSALAAAVHWVLGRISRPK